MAIVLDGTAGITTPDLTDTSLTSGRVVYAGTSGNLTGSSGLTFDGTSLSTAGQVLLNNNNYIGFKNTTGTYAASIFNDTSNFLNLYNSGNTGTIFYVNAAEQMRLTSTGLGIGTSSPTKILHVRGTSPVVLIEPSLGNQDTGLSLGRYTLSGTVSPTSTRSYIELSFEGSDDTYGTAIESRVITSSSRLNSAADLGFFTKVAGGNLRLERMTITPAGNVLIATTTSPSSSGVGSGFVIDSDGRASLIMRTNTTSGRNLCDFGNPNGSVGSISVSGSATAYNTSSDYRLKEDVQPMTGALAKVAQLKPVTYKWKADNSDGEGFIAHELAEVVPQCVNGEKDGIDADGNPKHQGVDTSFLVATLTAAIQEQQALITTLTERITALEGA